MIRNIIYLAIASIIACGCLDSGTKEKLGVSYKGPDEFSVIPHQTLDIPDDFQKSLPQPDNFSYYGSSSDNKVIQSQVESYILEQANIAIKNSENCKHPAIKTKAPFWKKLLDKDSEVHSYGSYNEPSPTSLQIIRSKPNYTTKSKRICGVENGAIKYCDDMVVIKQFSMPLKK
jgi:hypothetical protein